MKNKQYVFQKCPFDLRTIKHTTNLFFATATLLLMQPCHALTSSLTMKNDRDLQCTFWAGMGMALRSFNELGGERDDLFEERMQNYLNVHLKRYYDKVKSRMPASQHELTEAAIQREIDIALSTEKAQLVAHAKAKDDPQKAAQAYLVSKLKLRKCEEK